MRRVVAGIVTLALATDAYALAPAPDELGRQCGGRAGRRGGEPGAGGGPERVIEPSAPEDVIDQRTEDAEPSPETEPETQPEPEPELDRREPEQPEQPTTPQPEKPADEAPKAAWVAGQETDPDDPSDGELEDEPFEDDVNYDPLRDSPEAVDARRLIAGGVAALVGGAALTGGAIAMAVSDPCTRSAGNSCQTAARSRATATMAIPAALIFAAGTTLLAVGLVKRKKLRASVQAALGPTMSGLVVRARF